MKFNLASEVEQVCYDLKLGDYPRGQDRARINDLLNGVPPYTDEEVEKNNIAINVNFLEGTRIAHDARMQFTGNFLKPGKYFTGTTDMGPKHKRVERSAIVTRELAHRMKRSAIYYETFRSKFALLTAHGIGPAGWDTDDFWCPDALGIEDVLVPANTLLTMKNLPFFAIYRSYTAPEIIRLTRDRKAAAEMGWNLGLVDSCLEWVDQESTALMGNNWPEVWAPEKLAERVKGDGGFYAGDAVPTIDCFDFYFWDDDKDEEGWKRRVILDSWSTPSGAQRTMQRNSKLDFARNQFLFNSKNRKVASDWRHLVAFQFADLSAVAPFRYHSVRSLGYLLYAVCHLQNRLRCKFNEAVFEALMMYFRVKSMDEAERALKVELASRGFIDETLQFIPAAERFQVDASLVELGLSHNQRLITDNTSSFTQGSGAFKDRTEKTKFQVMAELQQMTAMISAAMQQAYRYQEFEYMEIFRRFCLPDSRDPDVKLFQGRCLAQGVPRSMLVPEAWNLEPERVLGAGNKTLEMAIAEQLMMYRNLYDPESQRTILRDVTLAITDDPGRTDNLVPIQPEQVTDSVHDAQLAAGTLLQGLPVAVKSGHNHIDYVDALFVSLEVELGRINQRGGVTTPEKLEGLDAIMQHLVQHIQLVAQDPNEKKRVSDWQKRLTRAGNLVKAFAQRMQEMAEKAAQAGGGNGADAELQAKLKAIEITAQAKAQNTQKAHSQRTAQRQVQFEMEARQKQESHALEMKQEQERAALESGARQVEIQQDLEAKRREAELQLEAQRQKNAQASSEKKED